VGTRQPERRGLRRDPDRDEGALRPDLPIWPDAQAKNREYSLMLSVVMAVVGVVMWIEGGPHPRTRAAWLLLVAILVVAAAAGAALLAVLLDRLPGRWLL
jgi:hypothetical protein